jgi:acetoin utilization protein AcuA
LERFLTDSTNSRTIHDSLGGFPLQTSRGQIIINPKCLSGSFEELQLDSGLGNFPHYSSIIQKLEIFERIASGKDGRVALALIDENIIVGYMVCWYPDSTERWSKLGELMYEFGAIEVSRNFRKLGIAAEMVLSVLRDDFFDEKISYMNGFSWHWDVDGSGLTLVQYRKMMLNFMKPFGFEEYYTNEPNIALREENLFMARIGSKVSEEDRLRFRNLRFGIRK